MKEYHTSRTGTSPQPPRGPAAMDKQTRGRWEINDPSEAQSNSYARHSPPRGYSRGRDHDRDREGYRSPHHSSRSRSRSPKRRGDRDRSPRYGGLASREVILEGLPVDIK